MDRFVKITFKKRQYNLKKEVLFFILFKLSGEKINNSNIFALTKSMDKYKLLKPRVLEEISKL